MPRPIVDPSDIRISDEERHVVSLCNEERARAGLPPLGMSSAANNASAWKSRSMADSGYFSHSDPNGRTFAQRMHDLEVPGAARENIACGYRDAEAVVAGWMGSEGHRANILAPDMRSVGVAVADNPSSAYGRYWTQVFTDAAPDELTPPAEPERPTKPSTGVPVLTSITPSSGPAGVGVQMLVLGANFLPSAMVWFDAAAQATTYVAADTLTAIVPGGHFPRPGRFRVLVINGPGRQSNDVWFTATGTGEEPMPPSTAPNITSWEPQRLTVGVAKQLRLTGTGFTDDTTAKVWTPAGTEQDVPALLMPVSQPLLVVLVPVEAVQHVGTLTVRVRNGEVWSNAIALPVLAAEPPPNPADLWEKERAWAHAAIEAYRR